MPQATPHASEPVPAPAEGAPATRGLRWACYLLLATLAVGNALGRITAVNSVDKAQLETHRVNARLDAERAERVAAGAPAAELAAWEAGRRAELTAALRLQRPFLSANDRSRWAAARALVEHGTWSIDRVIAEPNWDTIDKVRHRGPDGEMHFYSSKPPLLNLLLAAKYWCVVKLTGMTLVTHPFTVGRVLLALMNLPALALVVLVASATAERLAQTDWARLLAVATASFGTLLSPFVVVMNNHLIAAAAVAVAFYAWMRVRLDGDRRTGWFILAGAAGGFAAACELPALALTALLGLALLREAPRRTLLAGAPAALLVAAAFFATTYAAHQTWRPPYAYRSATAEGDNWYLYPGSYWENPQGVDRGEASVARYALHTLVGHHGVFSLTPLWALSVAGALAWALGASGTRRELGAAVLGLTLVVLTFYIALRPQEDRNYGGMTCGLRWLMWLTPLWLATLLPAADRLGASRGGRALCCLLLAWSALSAAYPTWNPWTHPWLFKWLESAGWTLT